MPLESEPFLTGEEMFTAWLADSKGRMCHIIGDVRKALRRWARGETKQRWCRLLHQGATPETNPDGAMHLCKLVRDELSSSMLPSPCRPFASGCQSAATAPESAVARQISPNGPVPPAPGWGTRLPATPYFARHAVGSSSVRPCVPDFMPR